MNRRRRKGKNSKRPDHVTWDGSLLHLIFILQAILYVARNGGQALVTPQFWLFVSRSGVSRRNNAPSPVTRIPERSTERVTVGTGPRYVEATKGRSNVTWFRPPVTRGLRREYYTTNSLTCQYTLCNLRSCACFALVSQEAQKARGFCKKDLIITLAYDIMILSIEIPSRSPL